MHERKKQVCQVSKHVYYVCVQKYVHYRHTPVNN